MKSSSRLLDVLTRTSGSITSNEIITVTGTIKPEQLGFTLSHEHLLIDYFWYRNSYSAVIDEEQVVLSELQHYVRAGGRSLVDCTNIGLGRNPLALRRISQASGLQIVMGSG